MVATTFGGVMVSLSTYLVVGWVLGRSLGLAVLHAQLVPRLTFRSSSAVFLSTAPGAEVPGCNDDGGGWGQGRHFAAGAHAVEHWECVPTDRSLRPTRRIAAVQDKVADRAEAARLRRLQPQQPPETGSVRAPGGEGEGDDDDEGPSPHLSRCFWGKRAPVRLLLLIMGSHETQWWVSLRSRRPCRPVARDGLPRLDPLACRALPPVATPSTR